MGKTPISSTSPEMLVVVGLTQPDSIRIQIESDGYFETQILDYESFKNGLWRFEVVAPAIFSSAVVRKFVFQGADLGLFRVLWPNAWIGEDLVFLTAMSEENCELILSRKKGVDENDLGYLSIPFVWTSSIVTIKYLMGEQLVVEEFDSQNTPEHRLVAVDSSKNLCEVVLKRVGLWWHIVIIPRHGETEHLTGEQLSTSKGVVG